MLTCLLEYLNTINTKTIMLFAEGMLMSKARLNVRGFCEDMLQLSLSLGFALLDLHCAGSLVVFFSCFTISRINFAKKHHSIFLFGSAHLTPLPFFCFHNLCLYRVVAEFSKDTVD